MMKLKTILISAIMALPIVSFAADFPRLTFLMSDNTELSVASDNLEINYSDGNLQLTSSTVNQSIPAETAGEMSFSGQTVTVAERQFDLNMWSKINVTETSVAKNTVEVQYDNNSAAVTISGHISMPS